MTGKILMSGEGKLKATSGGSIVGADESLIECCCGIQPGCTCKYSLDGLTNYFYQPWLNTGFGFPAIGTNCYSGDPFNDRYYSQYDRFKRATLYSSSDEFLFDSTTLGNSATPGRHRAITDGRYIYWVNCTDSEGNHVAGLNSDCGWVEVGSGSRVADPAFPGLVDYTYVPIGDAAFSKTNLVPSNMNGCFLPTEFDPTNPPMGVALCTRGLDYCDNPRPLVCESFTGNCLRIQISDGTVVRTVWCRSLPLPQATGLDCDESVRLGSGYLFSHRTIDPYTSSGTDDAEAMFPSNREYLNFGAGSPNTGYSRIDVKLNCDGRFQFWGSTCSWQSSNVFWGKAGLTGASPYPFSEWTVDPAGFSFSETMSCKQLTGMGVQTLPGSEFTLTFTGTWFTF